MKVIVVTGGIGSGKSAVCRIMNKRYGFPVYEADTKVKSLYLTHPSLLDDIESALGDRFRNDDGDFVPAMLAKKIFSDRRALLAVEGLVFPALMDDFRIFCITHPESRAVIFESATILEKPQFDGFGDFTVLVNAPYEVRLKRSLERDSSSQQEIMRRMDNQQLMNRLSSGEIDERVDYTVVNDSTFHDLETKINELVRKIAIT